MNGKRQTKYEKFVYKTEKKNINLNKLGIKQKKVRQEKLIFQEQ